MKIDQLAQMVATNSQLDNRETKEVIDQFLNLISSSLAAGMPVRLRGFGTFTIKTRKPRRIYDQGNKKTRWLEEGRSPHFRPSRALKDRVKP